MRIYRSVVLPGIVPILATLAIWTFLAMWNDFMWPLVVLRDETHHKLPVALFVRRYYIQGVMAGSVKG